MVQLYFSLTSQIVLAVPHNDAILSSIERGYISLHQYLLPTPTMKRGREGGRERGRERGREGRIEGGKDR